MFTRETIQKNQQTFANNTFTHCASTTINNSTATTSSGAGSSVATSTNSPNLTGSSHASSSLSKAAIAGIAVAVVIALLLLIGIRLQKRRRPSPGKIISARHMEQAVYQIEPFLGPPPGGESTQCNQTHEMLIYGFPTTSGNCNGIHRLIRNRA